MMRKLASPGDRDDPGGPERFELLIAADRRFGGWYLPSCRCALWPVANSLAKLERKQEFRHYNL